MTQLDQLAAARETVPAAQSEFRALAGRSGLDDVPPEPAALRESWERLIERIRSELGAELEKDLVEAAARSPLGTAIDDLPAHLRALATERTVETAHHPRRGADEDPGSSASEGVAAGSAPSNGVTFE